MSQCKVIGYCLYVNHAGGYGTGTNCNTPILVKVQMEKELRKALKFVGNEIAKGNQKAICHAFVPLRLGICDCKEFLAFDPKIEFHLVDFR